MNGGRSILPAFGLVDVHSHILPGMDDGARDVAESVDGFFYLSGIMTAMQKV